MPAFSANLFLTMVFHITAAFENHGLRNPLDTAQFSAMPDFHVLRNL